MSRRLLAGYLTLTVFVLAVLEVPLGISHSHSERQNLTARVERDAVVLTTFAEDTLEGRAGAIVVGDRPIGVIGEVSPQVLEAWGVGMPCAVFDLELNPLV